MKSWNEIGKELVMMITNGIKTGIKKGSEFITTQFPILCKQIITLGIIQNSVWVGMWVLILLVAIGVDIWLFPLFIKEFISEDPSAKAFLIVPFIAGLIVIITCFYHIGNYVNELLKAICSPMIYIIEYLKDFSQKD